MKIYFPLLLGTLAVASCMAVGGAGVGKETGRETKDIYYRSQTAADAALAKFDKDNPSCMRWTNWQKMCSRTGEKGSTWCTTDPDKLVQPSEPFCDRGYAAKKYLKPKQLLSVRRYCTKISAKGTGSPDAPCGQFSVDRPFNGYRVAARRHRFCSEWTEVVSQKKICSEKADSALPRCEYFDEKLRQNPERLFCSIYNNSAVENFMNEKNASILSGFGSPEIEITSADPDLRSSDPVFGIYAILENSK